MFSGGDSSGEFNNFRLASSGGSGGGITDWATLAQQWIAMRDSNAVPPDNHHIAMPDAPPPPNISGNFREVARTCGGKQTGSMSVTAPTLKKSTFEEKGEADMDMDDDEDNHDKRQDTPPPPAPSMHIGGTTKAQQNVMQPQWFMQPGQTQPTIAGMEMVGSNSQNQQWNAWPPATRISLPPPASATPVLHTQPQQQLALNVNPTSHIPSLMKINVSNPNAMKTITHDTNVDDTNASPTATMDAAKRKILPAWIREGLEKMEREKQKQMERQQPRSDVNVEDGISEHHTVKIKSSKTLESDSSGNDDDDDNGNSAANLNIDGERIVTAVKLHLSGNTKNDKIIDHTEVADHDDTDIEATELIVGKSYEENLADLMIIVRRTLTELLLEVTNDEIYNIAHETINLRKSKASSAQVIRKSALSSITGKLGLAAYDDSSSDAESGTSENEKSSGNDNSEDSEDEIRTSIRLKRRTFAKVSEEIEERIAASAVREEQKLKYYTQIEQQQQLQELETSKKQTSQQKKDPQEHAHHSSSSHHMRHESSSLSSVGGKGYERDFGETTESKLQHSNGKRQKERSTRKERTTRFSDNKDSRSASIATAASYISQMQSAANNSVNTSSATASLFQMATGGPIDPSHTYIVPTASYSAGSSSGSINKTLLNAAEAEFEKVTKTSKSSSSSSAVKQHRERDQRRRRHGSSHRHSSDDDDSSSDDDDDDESETSTSTSSRNSKYSRTSSSKHKRSDRSDSRSHYRKHSKTSSRKSKRSRRNDRSPNDYDDDYYSSRHSRHSSKRSRSRSRSSYSSSSHRRRH